MGISSIRWANKLAPATPRNSDVLVSHNMVLWTARTVSWIE